MNHKKLVDKVENQTGESQEVCIKIMEAYEKYCTDEIKRPFTKEIDSSMIDWISSALDYDQQVVNKVLVVLVRLVRDEVKSKLPFIK